MEVHSLAAPLVVRLLSRLEQQLDQPTRGTVVAELACYYARVGEFEHAEKLRQELRAEFSDGRSAPVSILIMVLESILLYFRELSPHARDRMLRANLLSKAFGEARLVALTSAWLAHIDFNQGRFDSMATAIQATFDSIAADDGTAACRVALVLGDAFFFCRKPTLARRWYEQARQSAVTLGDQATFGAVTYNRAALHVANLRLDTLSAPSDPSEIALARGALRSAINYQSIANLTSLGHLLQSSSVGVAILEERFGDALSLLDDQFLSSEVPPASEENALHQADLALCLSRVGRMSESRLRRQEVTQMPLENLGADERALIYDSLSRASEATADTLEAVQFRDKSRAALSEHMSMIGSIYDLIERFAEPRAART